MDVIVVAKPQFEKLHPEDVHVSGRYLIELENDVDFTEAASTALDIFHSTVPIKVLDDFVFTVMYKDAVLYQADDWNDFSGQDRGKLIDKVSDL